MAYRNAEIAPFRIISTLFIHSMKIFIPENQ